MIYLLFAVCIVLCSICGRAGGISKEAKSWIPQWMRFSAMRDWACPLFCFLPLFVQNPSLCFIPAYIALAGALSTYWDFLFEEVDNFWAAGFMCGVAGLFLMTLFPLHLIIIRSITLCVSWGILNIIAQKPQFKFKDGQEEYIRYAILASTSLCF